MYLQCELTILFLKNYYNKNSKLNIFLLNFLSVFYFLLGVQLCSDRFFQKFKALL